MKLHELFEAVVGYKPLEIDPVETREAIDLLNKHCKDALWMLYENHPIYRGHKTQDLSPQAQNASFLKIDPSKSERKSQNSTNHYTIIFDNNPAYSKFPKRSKSIIGSVSENRASGYSTNWSDGPYRVIPFDNVKIGIVNQQDMWDTEIDVFGQQANINDINDDFKRLGGALADPKGIEAFIEFDKLLKARDEAAVSQFERVFISENPQHLDNFLETIFKAYSPSKTGHTVKTTATMPHNLKRTEVWVGGPCFFITGKMWNTLLKEIGHKDAK